MTKPDKLTAEQKEMVEELAQLFFEEHEIEIIVFSNDSDDWDTCVLRGRLMGMYHHRKAIADLAKAGSSPAQTMYQKIISDYLWQQQIRKLNQKGQ